jgi:RHS repeat-associated protein
VPNGETTIFVYDASGKMVAEYSTIVAAPADAKTSYLTNDHLGSPRITTDGNGGVVSRRDFMPFGEEIYRPNQGTDKVRQKFTGYERDVETDLDFAQARMYHKNHGRFTSVDPLMASARISNPKTWNRYVYALNNPLRYIDPDGMDVNILDAEARRLLLLTLPEKIREKVNAAIEKGKGNLTKGSLDKIKSDDKNFEALKSMVNAKEITEAATSSTGENGVPFSQETHQQQYESDIQAYMKNNNVSREEAEKVITPPDNPNEVNFYRGQTYVPKGYVPNGEADANIPTSPSGNLRAVTTDRTGAGASISEEDAVVTFAHELYGHAYYFRQGNKTWYGHGKVITDIEDRTRQNYRNTEQKKNDPVNLKPKQ